MEMTIVTLNLVYAAIGAALALLFMLIGFKVFDRITPFDTSRQKKKKNTAVGIVVGSIFVGLGIAVGLVIGMGLN